jgi:hypothetical protein
MLRRCIRKVQDMVCKKTTGALTVFGTWLRSVLVKSSRGAKRMYLGVPAQDGGE